MGSLRSRVEQHYKDIDNKDWDHMREFVRPDVLSVMAGTEMRGVEPFIAYGQLFATAFPDMRVELLSTTEEGNTVVAESILRGTHTGPLTDPSGHEIPATGKPINIPVADSFVFEDGKLATHRVYFDQMSLMAQLGLLPAPTQT